MLNITLLLVTIADTFSFNTHNHILEFFTKKHS